MFGKRRKRGEVGPSPVGWISDEVWRGWNEADPEGAHTKRKGGPIAGAVPTPVTEDDRRRAKIAPVAEGAMVPPAGSVEEHAARLAGTTGGGFISAVRWPVCCERLTTLIVDTGGGIDFAELERVAGPLDDALTDAHEEPGAHEEPDAHEEPGEHEAPDAPGAPGACGMRAFWRETLAAMRAGEHGGDGIDFFQCRACGRVYGATCEA